MSGLTTEQQAAVEHAEGPLLVLAGPGSGKTRVICHRIARLIERGVRPDRILALTFTNKATREMAERAEALVPGSRVEVSTFHRFCAKLLRRSAEAVGLRPNYTILDQSEQVGLIRRLVADLDLATAYFEPSKIANRISRAKNELLTADDFVRGLQDRIGDPLEQAVAQVYPAYQQALLTTNCVDFDDLLLHVVRLLTEQAAYCRGLDEHYQYVLVDEYQDTNLAQYRIVAAISQLHPNLCATGDPDQSIYGWRGARIGNILSFRQDFPDAQVIRLDENFRSTGAIVRAADQLIGHNRKRPDRSLWTRNPEGSTPELLCHASGHDEAMQIAATIGERVRSGDRSWSDFAIFYRVNALSRQLETALSVEGVPFQIASGFAFYDRAEIKDLIAWLRLIENPDDDSALIRVVNSPPRGIGAKTIQRLRRFAEQESVSLFAAISQRDRIADLNNRAQRALKNFADLITDLRHQAQRQSVDGLLQEVLSRSGYLSGLEPETDERDAQRQANIDELISAARDFSEDTEDPSLQQFLESASLVSDVDNVDADAGRVTLMTLHAAKGLEFPVVFIVGVEHNLIPHERSLRSSNAQELEEERRLLFVGMTRAREELALSQTMTRSLRGSRRATIRSTFLDEIDLQVRNCMGDRSADPSRSRSSARKKYPGKRPEGQPLLMTAADMLKGNQRAAEVSGLYFQGMTVRHPHYGRGTVLAVSGTARRRTIRVEFETDGRTETFVADKCPLQPVG